MTSKKKSKICLILIIFVVLSGVVALIWYRQFVSYDLSELGQGYYWTHYWIEKMENKGNDWVTSRIVINPEVVECNFDTRFIHVKQNPNISQFNDFVFPTYALQFQRDSAYSCFYKQYAMGLCYWIVDKQNDICYGPFQRKAYRHTCDSLSIKTKLE